LDLSTSYVTKCIIVLTLCGGGKPSTLLLGIPL
jgi:hypothetical protein